MKNLAYFALVFLIGCTQTTKENSITIEDAVAGLTTKEFKTHLSYLSSDEMMGRHPGEPGYDSAASYVEKKIRALGLAPGGEDNTYRQPINFTLATINPSAIEVSVNGQSMTHVEDFLMGAVHEDVSFEGDVVFVGTGIHAPDLGYSDLDGVDIEGKVAMYVWRTTPEDFGSIEQAVHLNLMNERLKEKGAIGFISIVPPDVLRNWNWPLMTWLVSRPSMKYVIEEDEPYTSGIVVSYETAESWFEQDGKSFVEILSMIKEGQSPSYETSLSINVKASSDREKIVSDNLAAIKVGSDPVLKDEYLVITAHLDHDGISNPIEQDSIYNGTIDNASGSAALLVLAEQLAQVETKRSIMFLWVTAEERGLLGSEYFAKYPTIAKSKIVANQNMDGIVNLIAGSSDVVAYGYEHSNLSQSVDYALSKLDIDRSEDQRPEETFFVRSDQYSFIAEGIPAIWVIGGYNGLVDSVDAGAVLDDWLVTRYHKPNDDLDQPLNFDAAVNELKYNLLIAEHVANQLESVEWNKEGFLYKTFVGKE